MADPDTRSEAPFDGLTRSSQHLLTILECLPVGVIVVRPDGRIAAVNRQVERQFGYPREELIGERVEVLLPEDLHAGYAGERKGFMDRPGLRPTAAPRELLGRCKDGSFLPVEITCNWLSTDAGPLAIAAVVDLSERQRAERDHARVLAQAIEFDSLVADLTASFVDLRPEQVDQAIERALGRILDALDFDRATVFRLDAAQRDFVLTHHVSGPGVPVAPPGLLAAAEFPWSSDRIRRGEPAAFASVDEIPDEVERESARRYGTTSRIAFPLVLRGRIAGAISFATIRGARSWPTTVVGRLAVLAQVFGCALARQEADAALFATEHRFRTLADNAPVMIWTSGLDKGATWFNRQWLQFVGRPLERELGSGWTESIHPDDAGSSARIYEESFDARQPFVLEYRLRRHDGEWRWLLDSGAPDCTADGTFTGYIGTCVDVTDQKQAAERLEEARQRLHVENVYLRKEVKDLRGKEIVAGKSEAMRHVLDLAEQVAHTDSTVLLLGETGTGKEVLARHIHELSARSRRPMVHVNCAAIPATLIESELFGRERGAFTGATARQSGRFELADHSTMFLDEIGDLPIDIQVKLLRVLEERAFERLGSGTPVHVDTRIIAATHRNLEERIGEGVFREDLFYRLNVFPIRLPPLRERVEDIPALVWYFVDQGAAAANRRFEAIPAETMAELQRYSWPGNIRELRNVVERAMILATGPDLTISVPAPATIDTPQSSRLSDVEREHIRRVLDATAWRIRGAGGAADRLGLAPTTLESRMSKLGLTRRNSSSH